MRIFLVAILFSISVLLIGTPAEAASVTGIVLLHGKTGMPSQLAKLSDALTADGYLVSTPEMCWSRKRIFDKPLPDCLAEVDAAVTQLKAKGAGRIVVGGMSQGGVATLDYASLHPDLAGVIAMAPAADPLTPSKYPELQESIAKARDLAGAGKGDEMTDFSDLASGKTVIVHATPNTFLSFHGSTSPIGMVRSMEDNVLPKISMPLLWVAGSEDATQKIAPDAFAAVPKNAHSRYATVDSNHEGTPNASVDIILDWLKSLP